jgi:uncharacterized protein YkwD
MFRQLRYFIILACLVVASCARQTAQTEASTPANTEVVVPTNSPDCTNRAEFITDVTIPDYTTLESGEDFKKIWRVKNTGTCAWNNDYSLVFLKGEQMNAPDSQTLDLTLPGEAVDITVDMTAPSADAQYRADFELHNPDGNIIQIDQNTELWVIINVGKTSNASTGSGSSSTGSGTSADGPGFVKVSCSYTTDQANISAVITAINAYRSTNGLPGYVLNEKLAQAAQAHSADMACNNFFTHKGTNGSTPDSRVAAAGYSASNVSENVYGRYPSPSGAEAVTWWATDLTDTRHNANLISSEFTEIGVGYSFFDNFGYYVVVFASP